MSKQVTAHEAAYANLLNDKTIKRWYDNLKRGSPVTADVYLRRLGHICNDLKLTPQRLLGMNESQLYDLMLDTVSAMRKKVLALGTEEDLLIGLTFHNVPASLVAEFSEKIVKPYYKGNLNVAFQDLIHKALAEQDFVLSHITHVRNIVEA